MSEVIIPNQKKTTTNTAPKKIQYWWILGFFITLLLLRLVFRGQSLEIDEAEQVLWATQLHLGYPGQPPLYSWLQYFLFQMTGVNLFSLALLKYGLLLATVLGYYKLCCLYCKPYPLAWAATLAWILIPTMSFDLLKDNTHTILALLLAVLSWYYFTASRASNQSILWYCGFGILMGCGLLTKFNYAIFLAIFLLSALSLAAYRSILWHRYFGFSLLLTGLIVSPYYYWICQDPTIGLSSMHKIRPVDHSTLQGLAIFFKDLLLFILPPVLLSFLFFLKPGALGTLKPTPPLLKRYHCFALPLLLLLIIGAGFTYFETRWLIPILFLTPLLLFSRLHWTSALQGKQRLFILFCLSLEAIMLLALSYRGIYSKKSVQRQWITQEARSLLQANTCNSLASDALWLLGNLKLEYPQKQYRFNTQLQPIMRQLQLLQTPALLLWVNAAESGKPQWVERIESAQGSHCRPIPAQEFSYCII